MRNGAFSSVFIENIAQMANTLVLYTLMQFDVVLDKSLLLA